MSRHLQLYQWIDTVTMRFPSLSKPQDLGLALWSFRYGHCLLEQLNCCSRGVAPLFGQSHNTLRKRLRNTYRKADAKATLHNIKSASFMSMKTE